jgi:hypothetical protein
MRTIISLILIAALFFSCSKSNDVTPSGGSTTKTTGGTQTTPPVDTVKKPSHDDSIHMVAFNIQVQTVKTSVANSTLTLAFNENVNLFLTADAYSKTSAIHLIEDIKQTFLTGLNFYTINENGVTNYNFIDDNMNNVKEKSVTDTIINKVKMVKVNIHRPVTYSKVYASDQLATAQQNLLLTKTDDLITFSSYTYYNLKNYPVTSAVAYVHYIK